MKMQNTIVALVAVIVIGLIGYATLFNENRPVTSDRNGSTVTPDASFVPEFFTHTYENGTHTVSAMVTLPTPCHTVTATSRVAESFPEQIFIDFVVGGQDGICIQVLDERELVETVSASEDAVVRVTFAGAEVEVLSAHEL